MDSIQDTIKSSGEAIVNEILQDIFENVTTFSKYDITCREKESQGKEDHSEKPLNIDKMSPDLIALINDHTPSRILVHYTLKDAHVQVLQLKCTEQMASGYCGHYALHNALCILEVCNSLNEGAVLGFINETQSVVGYWRRYWYSLSQLLIRARYEEAWPWTEDYVYRGDMERSFLRHLKNTDPQLKRESNNIIVLQYSFGLFQHSFESISKMQDKIDTFISTPSPAHLIFILGVTNHWLTLAAYKTEGVCPCGCGQSRIHILYMDSNNVPVPSLTDKGIDDHMIKQEENRIKVKGRGYEDWKKFVIKQAYVDQRTVVDRLARYVSGRINLREEFVRVYVTKMMDSFKSHVTEVIKTSGCDLFVPLLINWLDSLYPVKILRETLTPFLTCNSKMIDRDILCSLKEWADVNLTFFEHPVQSGIPQVDDFVLLLRTITETLAATTLK